MNWLGFIPDGILRKVLGGQLRHILTFIAGALATISIPEVQALGELLKEHVTVISSGLLALVLYIGPAIWSMFQKIKK